eukprot:SAG31_NODE_1732_length_7421_cov_10.241191_2_plen_125_part_00
MTPPAILALAAAAAAAAAAPSVNAVSRRSAAGVPNMNGEYVISKTPGAPPDVEYNTKWNECAWERAWVGVRRKFWAGVAMGWGAKEVLGRGGDGLGGRRKFWAGVAMGWGAKVGLKISPNISGE